MRLGRNPRGGEQKCRLLALVALDVVKTYAVLLPDKETEGRIKEASFGRVQLSSLTIPRLTIVQPIVSDLDRSI